MELAIHDALHILDLCTKVALNLTCIIVALQKKDEPPADDRQPADRPQ